MSSVDIEKKGNIWFSFSYAIEKLFKIGALIFVYQKYSIKKEKFAKQFVIKACPSLSDFKAIIFLI